MDLYGKTVLVTGGARRVGAAICETLAARGCTVIIHYRTSSQEADQLAARLGASGVRPRIVKGDLRTERDCFELLQRAWVFTGSIDALVNNAAVFHRGDLDACDETALATEFQCNLVVPILLTREFAARAKQGRIINILDQRIARPNGSNLAYLLSKQALADFTRSAAVALAPGFTVNGVAPGPVLPPAAGDVETAREPAGKILLAQPPTPRDVADAVAYLLAADGVTGQIIFVDSGQHLL